MPLMSRAYLGFALAALSVSAAETPRTVIERPGASTVVKLEFGLTAEAPRRWSGRVSLSAGETLAAWGWRFDGPDRIEGTAGWDFQTRYFNPPDARYRFREELPGGVKVLPNGVFLALDAPPNARVAVATNRGDFEFTPAELDRAGRLGFLDGDAQAVAAPVVHALTRGEASQHDFPAAAAADGALYVAWTTYHNEANTVYLAQRAGGAWRTFRAADGSGDFYGTALAADAEGKIHVFWSEFLSGRWRLVNRVFDPDGERWGAERYVAPGGDRQFFPKSVTAADGRPWVAWQEFSADGLDIMAASYSAGEWSPPARVSPSAANDWAPAIAAAPDGAVWIAWDGYDAGNYDIFMRRLDADGAGPVIAAAQTALREIEPSVAVDADGAVWAAWAESGANWGKDWGVLGRPGTQLRASSRIRLARYAGGKWTAPAQPLENAVPVWMSEMHEYPHLVIGPDRLPYLFFRKMLLRHPVEDHELNLQFGSAERRLQPWYDTIRGMSSLHLTAYDGARWLPVREFPLSSGGAYAQLATAAFAGKLAAVWPSDGRSYADPHVRTSQIRYAELSLENRRAATEAMRPPRQAADFENAAPTEQADLARVRAARWEGKAPLKLFRGDLHRHTDLSADSQRDGDILFAYRYALDAGALDFLAVTDHSGAERLHFYKYQWWRTRQIATMFNRPGRFATFFGYERTVTFPGGHRNVISTRRRMQPVPISDEEFYGVESWAERLYPALIANGDIAIAHTTAGGGGTDWRDNDPRAEPVVEVFQALRGSYEEQNGPAKANASQAEGFVWNAWKKGWKLGLLANSDHESTHQSYAAVWAPELRAEVVLDAIKQRRTFAATDNIVLQFEAAGSRGEPAQMGSVIAAAEPPELRIRVAGTAPIDSLEVIRNGLIVHRAEPGRAEVDLSFRDADPPDETAWYHVRLVQRNGQIAWSSPIWVEYR